MKNIVPSMIKRSGWHLILSLLAAAVFTVLTVLQLFWFEDMPNELAVLLPIDWAEASIIIAVMFVIAEVLAVAYLLPIALSPLARWCTRILALVVPLGWLLLTVSALIGKQAANTAFLGPKLDLNLSWISVVVMVLLLSLVVVVSIADVRKS